MKMRSLVVLSSLALGASSALAGLISDYDLVVTGDATARQHVDGKAFIGGNLHNAQHSVWGSRLDATANQGIKTLEIGGNLSGNGLTLQAGVLQLQGSNTLGAHQLVLNNGSQLQPGMVDSSGMANAVSNLSSQLSSLVGDSAGTLVPGSSHTPTNLTFQAGSGLSVFNIDGNAIFNTSDYQNGFSFNIGAGDTAVVNVSGTNIDWRNGNFTGNQSWAGQVVWNFFEAETIFFDRAFIGSIVAPNATLTHTNNIEGGVFVQSLNQFGEIHVNPFTGTLPNAVPMPSAVMMGAAGLFGVCGSRRRKVA